MLRIRLVEERIAALYPQQQMRCPVHLSIGQEAVSVGVCASLTREEYCISSHRAHGHYLAKGGDLKSMIAELYGRVTGCCKGKGGSMHLIDRSVGMMGAVPIVGSTIPVGVGMAWGSVLKGRPTVVVVFFGDGAVEEGVFHESMNFAALKNLPVVFVCENNFYSVYSSLNVRQPPQREIYQMAAGYSMEGQQGDGNNVLEVYEIARRAIQRAREGRGPTFLEFKTYRWMEHCGPYFDNDLGYRPQEEFRAWQQRCPIQNLEQRLLRDHILTLEDIDLLKKGLALEIDEAFHFAQCSPYPDPEHLSQDVYETHALKDGHYDERVEIQSSYP